MIYAKLLFLPFLLLLNGSPDNRKSKENYLPVVREDLPFLLPFYKKLHQMPEVSLFEKETSALLASELRKIGFTVTENIGNTYGIVGMFKNGDGPTILYRTDMDALPMLEKTGLPYASTKTHEANGIRTGVMHSCGHDMHMSTWLGTARALVKMKDRWKGTLMLVGQPAEEIGVGARAMIEAGLYETFGVPDYAIGLHCSPTIEVGKVGYGKGYTMANSESVTITVYGVGAHGASPHMSVDPIVLSSLLIMDLQTITSRNLKPIESAVVTVGSIHAGTASNIIPDEVTLGLTLRTFKEDVRQMIHKRIVEICNGTAMAAGLPPEKYPKVVFPPVYIAANYNNELLVDKLSQSAKKVLGDAQVVDAEVQMVAEDFSAYGRTSHRVPSVLFWLGTASEERIKRNDLPGLHSPFYYPEPEKSLETGVLVTAGSLIDLFNGK
jgi:hippurate hydrolase